MTQTILEYQGYDQINTILRAHHSKKVLIVCDDSFSRLSIVNDFKKITVPTVVFNEFTSNPLYEDVCKGREQFYNEHCDSIIAVGGGSAIDVAKCIKLFSTMNASENFLKQKYASNDILLIAIPTTSGTGSESTKFSVVYYNGEKQSVTHDSLIPSYALLDSIVLKTLPIYQKKCTALDALCQGIESWWSINATNESQEYSQKAVEMIVSNFDSFLRNEDEGNKNMMVASNYAGQAINITQTTAPHAMSYKLTSLYNIPHGRAVALCLPHVWKTMIDHLKQEQNEQLSKIFLDISHSLGFASYEAANTNFYSFVNELFESEPINFNREDVDVLTESVNTTRLKNNPIPLSTESIKDIYHNILNKTF